jgi:hypothetical protein
MAEFSYPFDGGSGAILTEDDWSNMASNWQDDGVIVGSVINSTSLTVVSTGAANTVVLQPGSAMIQGFMYRNTEALPLTFATNTSSVGPRRDRVVLQLDRNTNTIQAIVKQGTPSGSPVPPGLNTTYPIYEISLASFSVGINGGNTVTPGAVLMDRPITSRYIRVTDTTTGQPEGSILFAPTANKFYTVGIGGTAIEIGANPTDTELAYVVKNNDGSNLSGSAIVNDPDVFLHIPNQGQYHVSGQAFFTSNTASSTCTFSLYGPGVSWVWGTIVPPSGVFNTAGGTFSGAAQLTALTSNTVYAVKYDFVVTVAGSSPTQTIGIRTNAHSGSSVWKLLRGSYMRIERMFGE